MPTDAELLRQYVKDGSEAAFTELVQRYAGLVYATALRTVGGRAHLARDVTQDVFILLARKAPGLTAHEALAAWLHVSTRHIALTLVRNLQKRETLEQAAAAMPSNSAPEIQWEQLRPLLDEAVEQLDDRDRNAVLLRYFQGRSHREVGAALGQTEDAARMRIERAVEKLRRHFARHGMVTTAALLAETLTANAAESPPPGLVAEVAAAAHAQGLSAGPAFLKLIFMTTQTKIVASLVVFALVLAGVWQWRQSALPVVKEPAAVGAAAIPTPPAPARIAVNPSAAVPSADLAPKPVPPEDNAQLAAATPTTTSPREALNAAILDILQLSAAKDYDTLVRNYTPIKAVPAGMTLEQVVQDRLADPGTQQAWQSFAETLESVKDSVPEFSADGRIARLRLPTDPTMALVFVQLNNSWRISGLEKSDPGAAPASPPGQKKANPQGGGYVP